ncbi:MAG: HAD-IIIA family hydrolase [Thermoplasmataceae archaeon]
MNIKAVLLDMDGTLLDSERLSLEATDYAFRSVLGRGTTPEESSKLIGKPISKVLTEWFADKGHEIYYTGRSFFKEHMKDITVYPGVLEMIHDLKNSGLKIGVVSSSHVSDIVELLGRAGILQYLDTYVGQEDTEYQKPDPEPLNLALRRLNVKPSESVYVGDQQYDIVAAHEAGITAIAAIWGMGDPDSLDLFHPDFLADSPEKVVRIVLGL